VNEKGGTKTERRAANGVLEEPFIVKERAKSPSRETEPKNWRHTSEKRRSVVKERKIDKERKGGRANAMRGKAMPGCPEWEVQVTSR